MKQPLSLTALVVRDHDESIAFHGSTASAEPDRTGTAGGYRPWAELLARTLASWWSGVVWGVACMIDDRDDRRLPAMPRWRDAFRLATPPALIAGVIGVLLVSALSGAPLPAAESKEALAAKVRARETAFARTMADRDHAAFATFVAEEALFMGRTVLRGRKAVAEGWKPYFEAEKAPFSWQPDRVEVVDSGTLAFSTGPVFDPGGKRVGTFNSTWRLERDGEWRVVLDSGCPPCACP